MLVFGEVGVAHGEQEIIVVVKVASTKRLTPSFRLEVPMMIFVFVVIVKHIFVVEVLAISRWGCCQAHDFIACSC